MEKSFSESYKAAGVDITAGYRAVELMQCACGAHRDSRMPFRYRRVRRPVRNGSYGDAEAGARFGHGRCGYQAETGIFDGQARYGGHRLRRHVRQRHHLLPAPSRSYFPGLYRRAERMYPEKVAAIVAGVAEGCVQAGCALVGGETAEMPGFYPEDEYDLAGFAVGAVDKSKILDYECGSGGRCDHWSRLLGRAFQRV